MNKWTIAMVAVSTLGALAALALTFAPFGYAEVEFMTPSWAPWPPELVPTVPLAGAAAGTLVDGYWQVQQIAPDTYAIGEPHDQLDNYEYLLIGKTRALLIDAGATRRDIHPVLATLTNLPVTVIPTHLHSDHTNGLQYFSSIALIDLHETRLRVEEGKAHLGRYQYMDTEHPPVFQVSEWVKPDAFVNLGERRVQVLSTPGHTTTSISVHDAAAKLLFAGDLICTCTLYAFMPDSSLSDYVATAYRLLTTLPADTVVYGAHCCRNDAPAQAPWLGMNDVRDVRQAVQRIRNGSAMGRGLIIRRFPVNSLMTIVTFYPFANR